MKHAFVDETLTRTERESPFRLADLDAEPLDGPMRLGGIVTETEEGISIEEIDVLEVLRAVGINYMAMDHLRTITAK